MSFDPTKPSTSLGTFADALDSTRANLVDLNDRVSAQENLALAALKNEVVAARGTKGSVKDRLTVSLDDAGNLKFDSLKSLMWAGSGDVPSYVNNLSFTVPGDKTTTYLPGMLLRLAHGATNVYAAVSIASYASGTALTTVNLRQPVLTASLSAVSLGLASIGQEDPLIPRRLRLSAKPSYVSYPVEGAKLPQLGANFVRSGPATGINRRGQIESVIGDLVRQQYDPQTKGLLGWLIEGQRTNLFTYSNQLDHSSWNAATNATAAASQGITPDGTNTAVRLTADTSVSGQRKEKTVSVTASVAKSVSVWIKAGTQNTGSARIIAVGSATHTLSVTPTSDWVRYTLNVPSTDTGTSLTVRVYPSSDITGALGDNILVWNTQLEEGAYPTSDIITVATSVTRATDQLTHSVAALGIGTSGEDFTWLVETILTDTVGTVEQIIGQIDDGTNNNLVSLTRLVSRRVSFQIIQGGTLYANPSTTLEIPGSARVRIGLVVKKDAFKCAIAVEGTDLGNGVGVPIIISDDTGNVPTGLTTHYVGNRRDFTRPVNGIAVRQMTYPFGLSQSDLVTLVSFM